MISNWSENESKIVYGGSQAYYSKASDEIHLPIRGDFYDLQEFYATALHEIGHSTGHTKRLSRDLSGKFGSPEYAMEELRAEIASVFLEQDFGVEVDESAVRNNSAYIQHWKTVIQKDPNLHVQAGGSDNFNGSRGTKEIGRVRGYRNSLSRGDVIECR